MEDTELLKRAEDLCRRCAKTWDMTNTAFLTPAERLLLRKQLRRDDRVRMLFYGGYDDCERSVAFFLPEEGTEEGEEVPDSVRHAIRAVCFKAYFGEPGHRDYLGALLASGIARDRLGDILISGTEATVFCLPGILQHLLTVDRIGRVSVKAEELPLDAVTVPKRERKEKSISVMSMRLDAVAAGIFNLSRTSCAKLIAEGNLSFNYSVCMKADTPVHEGDVISLRGHGKAVVGGLGGSSRKGRQFVTVEIYA
ncbi:MAG: hypothetical protein IJV40_13700 [Oscillospiraceae bacterium]|nr:hypothetical protein [Oscillospiraceae bacterium]